MAMDWPLSREEKKKQVLRLYNEDVQTANSMLHSGEKALEALRKELEAARLTAGLPCTAKSVNCQDDASEVARLRSVVENASAVLRAILPSHDDVDPVGNAGALEAAQRRRKSFGSVREQSAPSALKKPDSRRNSVCGDHFRVSFADDDKKHFNNDDVDAVETVEVETEPMLEPEPSPPIEDIPITRLCERPQPSASVLHWFFDLIVQRHRSLHDIEHSRFGEVVQDVRGLDDRVHAPLHSRDGHLSEVNTGEVESTPRCELRLLLDVKGLVAQEQDSEEAPCLQQRDAASMTLSRADQQTHDTSLPEQEVGPPQESDSSLPQRQGHRRARLRARMHGYAFCDENGRENEGS